MVYLLDLDLHLLLYKSTNHMQVNTPKYPKLWELFIQDGTPLKNRPTFVVLLLHSSTGTAPFCVTIPEREAVYMGMVHANESRGKVE